MTSEKVLSFDSSFQLVGYLNPLDIYPSAVAPLLSDGKSYYAVYQQHNKGRKKVKISEGQLRVAEGVGYIKINSEKRNDISKTKFNPDVNGLFALNKDELKVYDIKQKNTFYKNVLSRTNMFQEDPFMALPVAIKIRDINLISDVAFKCGLQLKSAPQQLKYWYDDLRQNVPLLPERFSSLENSIKINNRIQIKTINKLTKFPKVTNRDRIWFVLDLSGLVLGRSTAGIAHILLGKHKTTYSPHLANGDYVVVINSQNVRLTGKKWKQKNYYRHSGYIGGLRQRTAEEMLKHDPEYLVKHSVKGMLPKNKLGRSLLNNIKVYTGSYHPHEAQCPIPLGAQFRKLLGCSHFDLTNTIFP